MQVRLRTRALMLAPEHFERLLGFYSEEDIRAAAEEFATQDMSWGADIHMSVLPWLVRRPIQVRSCASVPCSLFLVLI